MISASSPAAPPEAHDHVCWGCGHDHRAEHGHALEVRGLSVSYGPVKALERVEFGTACGRSLALVGPNGGGKSTLLKSLAGLVPRGSGEILWRQRPLAATTREIAYLPQREDVDWSFPITVRGLVEMGRYPSVRWWRRFGSHDREMVERALATMGLESLQDRQISALSGGQQQRAFIARALAQEAHVLLLDEPFAGLDLPAQETLQSLFGELVREGRLLIASHHDLETVPRIFDDVLLLRCRQIGFGPAAQVLNPAALAEAFGLPEGRAGS